MPASSMRVGDPPIVVQAALVGRATPRRLDARPGDRVTIGLEVQLLQQRDVVAVAMVAVAGHIAGVAVLDVAGSVAEPVPDGLALAIFLPGAFDLVGGGGGAPQKARRESTGGMNGGAGVGGRGCGACCLQQRLQRHRAQCERGMQQVATVHEGTADAGGRRVWRGGAVSPPPASAKTNIRVSVMGTV